MGLTHWLFRIAFGKAIKRVVQLVIAWAAAHNLDQYGVTLDPNGLTLGIYALLEIARNWLKVRVGLKWL
jgi:hypothetical protein